MPKGWELLWALHIQGSQNTAHPRVQEGNWLFSLTIICTQWSRCWVTSQSKQVLCCPPKAVRTAQGTLGTWVVHCLHRSTCYYIHWIKQCTSETSPQHSFSGFLFYGDNGHYPHENKTLPFFQAPTWLSIYRKHCSFQNMLFQGRCFSVPRVWTADVHTTLYCTPTVTERRHDTTLQIFKAQNET